MPDYVVDIITLSFCRDKGRHCEVKGPDQVPQLKDIGGTGLNYMMNTQAVW